MQETVSGSEKTPGVQGGVKASHLPLVNIFFRTFGSRLSDSVVVHIQIAILVFGEFHHV